MNQILKPEILLKQEKLNKFNSNPQKNENYKYYKIQLTISCIIAFCFIIFLFIRVFTIKKNENISQQLMDIYNVSTLYSNNTNYSAQLLESSNSQNISNYNPFVIGIIKIDKINLNYPILSESSDELLDISLCRFAGPMPNEARKFMYCWT